MDGDDLTPGSHTALLECRDVTKAFSGVQALDGVSFALAEGEVVGVAGANGAGKSTLFNVIAGAIAPTSGEVWLTNRRIDGRRPDRVCGEGVARTFQTPPRVADETVIEHVMLGAWYGRRGLGGAMRGRRQAIAGAFDALDAVGIADRATAPAADLSHFDRKRLMLAAALACEPRLLLLDELAGGLAPDEVDALAAIVNRIPERGIALLVIEHLMSFLATTVARLVVMHEGQKLYDGRLVDVSTSREVIETWLGTGLSGAVG